MKKIGILALCLTSTLSASKVVVTWNPDTQQALAHWQEVERCLKKNAQSLAENLQKLNAADHLNITIDSKDADADEPFKSIIFKLSARTDTYSPLSLNSNFLATDKGYAMLTALYVENSLQQKGLGKHCIKIFDSTCLATLLGYHTILINSTPSARGFYKKLGFTCDYDDFPGHAYYWYTKKQDGLRP